MGEFTQLDSTDPSKRAYLLPPAGERGPGLLLLHAWWGLTEEFQRLAERFTEEGFLVLAPDYYRGETASTIEEAKALRSKMDRKVVNTLVRKAADHLLGLPALEGDKLSAVGFSLGCGYAIGIARARPDAIGAVVLFYGTGGGKFDRVKARFQGHFAEHDAWGAGPKKVRSLEKRLRDAGVSFDFFTYPGTEHWFFEHDREQAYHVGAAEEAWSRTIEFLRETSHAA